MVEGDEDRIYDKETEDKELNPDNEYEDDDMGENSDADEEFDSLEYDSGDFKVRLDHMEKRLMKMEEMMTNLIEQNTVPEDDEELYEGD